MEIFRASMSHTTEYAIEVENLTKDFKVLHRVHTTLKTAATATVKSIASRSNQSGFEMRRALDNISFNVKHGESVAIIGRNGSGKSTILSILSRVYLPTSGTAKVNGSMISLLELGAGFNPEMTGEENVYFNTSLMGLTQQEAEERYPDIIAFSELDPSVLDLPVRMYSSGMQMRLAFAIAVNLDADILVFDEGLAVGDAGFQVKCKAKMIEQYKTGKTLLNVTHAVDGMELFIDRAVWLDRGKLIADGDFVEVSKLYRESFLSK